MELTLLLVLNEYGHKTHIRIYLDYFLLFCICVVNARICYVWRKEANAGCLITLQLLIFLRQIPFDRAG